MKRMSTREGAGLARRNAALLAGSVVGATLTLLVLQALQSWAADPPADQLTRVMPYQGRLERDGVAVDGPAEMRFRLYARGESTPLWTEVHQGAGAVTVSGGRFQALLGASTAFTTAVLDAEDLYLGVEVKRDGQWEALGKQPVAPTTYALWTAASTNLRVGDALTVGRDAELAGPTIAGPLRLTPSAAQIALGGRDGAMTRGGTHQVVFGGGGVGDVALGYDTSTNVVALKKGGATLLSSDADTGAMTFGGALDVHGTATAAVAGDVRTLEGHDVVIPGAGRVVLGQGSSGSTVLFGSAGSPGLRLQHVAYYNLLSLAVPGASQALVIFGANATGGFVTVNGDVLVEGDLILAVYQTSGFSTLEGDDVEGLFKASSTCVEGAIRAAIVEGQSAICACREDGADDDSGRGWYCLQ